MVALVSELGVNLFHQCHTTHLDFHFHGHDEEHGEDYLNTDLGDAHWAEHTVQHD